MPARLAAVCVDAHDPGRLARFWAGLLDREVEPDAEGVVVLPATSGELQLDFAPSDEPRRGRNQMHFDLTSTSYDGQQQIVERALTLGASHLDVGQLPEEEHVVLADPEGNEFCVIEPDNGFLAGTGRIGALASDGTRDVGLFWSSALGWPLVWDQDEETAIQSPAGGTKISWGGPPIAPKRGKNRLHLDVAPPLGGDQQTEVDRLLSLGARRVDIGQGDVSWAVLADPGGNEFCVLAPR